MQNELFTTAECELNDILQEESEGLIYVKKYIETHQRDLEQRTIGSNCFTSEPNKQDTSHLDRLFEDISFEWGEDVNAKIISYLTKNKSLVGKMATVEKILSKMPERELPKIVAMVCLREGGQEIIEEKNLFDLTDLVYPISVRCEMCQETTEYGVPFQSVIAGGVIQGSCIGCNHAPVDSCKCDTCSSAHVVFDIAKLVEQRVDVVIEDINAKLETLADNRKSIPFDVDMNSLLAQFLAARGGLSADAHKVVTKALEVFKVTGKFEFNTYQFASNVIGEDGDIRSVARELVRSGFHYRSGIVPRKSEGNYPTVKLTSDHKLKKIYMLSEGGLVLGDAESTPEDSFDEVVYIDFDGKVRLNIDWSDNVKTYDDYSINHWALEHLSHGGVYNNTSTVNKLDGEILKDEAVRKAFLAEIARSERYVFPNIKVASLVELEDIHKILNSSSVTLLENFEAALVAYNKSFEPEVVYIHKGHKDINLFDRLIEPNLVTQGIIVEYIS
ncbi:hypothetical protein VCHA53O466_40231 [Vibrio chagasii]|nr:hypothetical protein VCHA53O466_40231 [Vibrio chagasii]